MWTVPGNVVRVIDGDTLVVDLDLGWRVWRLGERVRLAGINAPEMDTEQGRAARMFACDLLHLPYREVHEPAPVTVMSKGFDKYGRVLGIVILSDAHVLANEILNAGHAQPMKG